MNNIVSRPIFIIGAPRSGTSILTWALGQHPNIQPLEETNWIALLGISLREIWKIINLNTEINHLRSLGWSEDHFYQIFGQKVDDIVSDSLPDQILFRANQATNLTKRHQKDNLSDRSREYLFSLNDENSALKIIRSPNDPKKRWIDGTPENTFYAHTLLRLFPNARFIHLLRHPDDVCASLMNFANVGGKATNFLRESSYIAWIRYVSSAYLLEKALGGDIVCRIRYEDLIKSPAKAIKVVLTWLGEEFNNACIEPFAVKLNSSAVNSFKKTSLALRDTSLSLLSEILQSHVGTPDPSAREELIAINEQIICTFTTKENEIVVNIDDWGPRETPEKTRFNIQHDAISCIWIKARGLLANPNTYISFGEKVIANQDISFSVDFVSFYVRDELIEKSGSYEIKIIQGNSFMEIKIGSFRVIKTN